MDRSVERWDLWYNWANKLLNQWLVEANIRHCVYGAFNRDLYKRDCTRWFLNTLERLRLAP